VTAVFILAVGLVDSGLVDHGASVGSKYIFTVSKESQVKKKNGVT
jgi:hypothetical protein